MIVFAIFCIIVGLIVRFEPSLDKVDERWIVWYKVGRFSDKREYEFLDEIL